VVLSATSSRLLPLQLGFKRFQYITLSYISLLRPRKPFNQRPTLISDMG